MKVNLGKSQRIRKNMGEFGKNEKIRKNTRESQIVQKNPSLIQKNPRYFEEIQDNSKKYGRIRKIGGNPKQIRKSPRET